MKYVALLLLLIISFSVIFPAEASVCRNYNGQQICILSIKRSAKNYWEYRAAVSVNGVTKPVEVYNCRNFIKIEQSGKILPFVRNDPGELICSFFNKS